MAIIGERNFGKKEKEPKVLKIKAADIKLALMHYFRFQRQYFCATECMCNDVMAFKGTAIIEVEVKISKHDLWKGEAKKEKHPIGERVHMWGGLNLRYSPNLFYIAVPKKLQDEAVKWVNETSNRYGIIVCDRCHWDPENVLLDINTIKSAKLLHKGDNSHLKYVILKRLCAENIKLMEYKLLAERDKVEKCLGIS